jgi:transposase
MARTATPWRLLPARELGGGSPATCWRRLQVRWDRDSGRWFAFVLLACAVVCFNRL